jgi:hypothetical protein
MNGKLISTKSVLMQPLTNFSKDSGMGQCDAESLNSSQDRGGF